MFIICEEEKECRLKQDVYAKLLIPFHMMQSGDTFLYLGPIAKANQPYFLSIVKCKRVIFGIHIPLLWKRESALEHFQ